MRLLVLGGTRFLSREVAAQAVAGGHAVACACRGSSGSVPDGATLVRWDRSAEAAEPAPVDAVREALGGEPDAVVDVARLPSHVRAAVAAWPAAHHVFVSTVNVYDESAAGPDRTPLLEAVREDVPMEGPDDYGAMKVGCEQLVAETAASVAIVRPGLIVGPDDPSGRFAYWPERLAAATGERAEVLAPDPTALVQVIDVRDLAAWLLDLAEHRTAGTWDAVGPATPVGVLLDDVAAALGAAPTWRHLDDAALVAAGVEPWMGERSLPLWLPRPEYDGMANHDAAPAAAAGLAARPVGETAVDTLTWLRATPDAGRTGLTAEEESEVLAR